MPKSKKKTKLLLLPILAFTALVLIFTLTILPSWRKQLVQKDLTKIISSEWQTYLKDKPGFKGGVAMQVLSPKGNYFISANMGNADSHIRFRTASISKTFTSAAIMLLHQQGKLNIEDKIVDKIPTQNIPYVPDTPDYNIPHKKDITIKQLLMHRSGVYDISNSEVPVPGKSYLDFILSTDPDHTFTFDELLGVNAKYKLSYFAPGQDYHYSDTGFSLLGKIIERVSGQSYADFIHDNFLAPNGLTDTSVVYQGSDNLLSSPFAPGYQWADGESEDVTRSNMSPHVAEGSVITTPHDLAHWAQKLFNGQAGLNKETVRLMMDACTPMESTTTPDSKYGYGLVCNKSGYGHNGAHIGYLSNMMYQPETGVTFVIFTNSWNVQSFEENNIESLIGELKQLDIITQKVLNKLGY